MKKVSFIVVVMLILSLAIAGCGGSGEQAEEKPKEAVMIVEIPKGDPFIDLAYSGLEQLGKDKGVNVKIIEALDKSEHEEQIRAMAELGANPIYVLWDNLGAAVIQVAPDFPDTKFIIADAYVETDLENVKTVVVEPQEASFIAGFVAAKTSESKHVGFVGSMDTPIINRFRAGFEAGVKYADKNVKVESVYAGNANDPNKGSEIAKLIIGNGADVIMHAANKTGLGVIKACEEEEVLAIGVDEWQGKINPDVVFWSALKDIAGAIYKAGESALDGSFVPGMQVYDISTGISLYDSRDFEKLPDELQQDVLALVEELKAGKITVPTTIN
ncbi:MAG: BMP family ABC transporter substrate-binding protein [Thermoanaerobacteraceae bacterium]|nr:BMP family ABC transporter substrate-binding protein [Thermoanaerobacteraceae bacterium]